MTDKFLKAKHWQLFLLTFGIPMIFQFIMMGSMLSNFATQANPDPAMMFNYMKFFPVIMILFIAVFFGWFWSVAIGLQKKVPENVTMKVKKFKVFFFIPLIYIIIFMTVFIVSMNNLFSSTSVPSFGLIGGLFAIIFPLHLFAMFCIFYSLSLLSGKKNRTELADKG